MLGLHSDAFGPDGAIPAKFTCDGSGVNPPLRVDDVPAQAKSLALIVFDPDVPRSIKADGRYLHWTLWNLPAETVSIAEGRTGGLSEGGRTGYIPPCPSGAHRYVFQLFALDSSLGDKKISGEQDLRQAMQGHVIEQTELVGRYGSRTSGLLSDALPVVLALAIVAVVYTLVQARRSS